MSCSVRKEGGREGGLSLFLGPGSHGFDVRLSREMRFRHEHITLWSASFGLDGGDFGQVSRFERRSRPGLREGCFCFFPVGGDSGVARGGVMAVCHMSRSECIGYSPGWLVMILEAMICWECIKPGLPP